VVTEIGAWCTSGACRPARSTAFPRRARSRKGEVGGAPSRQPPPETAGAPGLKLQGAGWSEINVLIAVLGWLAIWNCRALIDPPEGPPRCKAGPVAAAETGLGSKSAVAVV
jgi:hypothetical protein